jgi:hypothetical protein
MSTAANNASFSRMVDPVLSILTPDQAKSIVNFSLGDAIEKRVEELANKCNEGELTPEECDEYEGYVRANRFLVILKAQARRRLNQADA